jgi:hypothetical protein
MTNDLADISTFENIRNTTNQLTDLSSVSELTTIGDIRRAGFVLLKARKELDKAYDDANFAVKEITSKDKNYQIAYKSFMQTWLRLGDCLAEQLEENPNDVAALKDKQILDSIVREILAD